MYSSYWNRGPRRRYNYYPSNNYGSYGRNRYRYPYTNYGSYDDYYYGNRRNRLHWWERDDYNYYSRNVETVVEESEPRPTVTPPTPSTPPAPAPRPRPRPSTEELAKVLNVQNVNLHIEENSQRHRTDKFSMTDSERTDEAGNKLPEELLVRRGDMFMVTITFDRPYDIKKNDADLVFSIGEHPNAAKGTEVSLKVDESLEATFELDEWGARLKSKPSGKEIVVEVHIACNSIVGEWNLFVHTHSEGKDAAGNDKLATYKYEHHTDITVLFNPWCKGDGTYMATEQLLDEYVLNDNGCVWRGSAFSMGAKPWNYAQFDERILECALYLVLQGFGGRISVSMSDPIKVSRMIAKMVNSNDDNGVLSGNWSGEYDDGVAPGKWVGSKKILTQYLATKRPVKYGQCWVFACLTTTICRAMGIPCRTITNFDSAHDSDGTLTIDKFFRRDDQNKLQEASMPLVNDSVWNYHCWNEVWVERSDLESDKLNGWQALDATPQETSEGVFTCGPCPVAAVKRGLCNQQFDSGFVFAEVNGDEIEWEILPDKTLKRLHLNYRRAGHKISTKKPDGKPFERFRGLRSSDEDYRVDITSDYKYPDGSIDGRNAVMTAHKYANKKLDAYSTPDEKEDIELRMKHSNDVMIGEPLEIQLRVKNKEDTDRLIKHVRFLASPMTYTDEHGEVFFRREFDNIEIRANDEKVLDVRLDPKDYLEHLIEQSGLYLEVTAVAFRQGGDSPAQSCYKAHRFRFRRPDIDVQGVGLHVSDSDLMRTWHLIRKEELLIGKGGSLGLYEPPSEPGPATCRARESVDFTLTFTNPQPVELTDCVISVDSSGFRDVDDIKQRDVPAGGEFQTTLTLVAMPTSRERQHTVAVSFDSKQLSDVSGSATITIKRR